MVSHDFKKLLEALEQLQEHHQLDHLDLVGQFLLGTLVVEFGPFLPLGNDFSRLSSEWRMKRSSTAWHKV